MNRKRKKAARKMSRYYVARDFRELKRMMENAILKTFGQALLKSKDEHLDDTARAYVEYLGLEYDKANLVREDLPEGARYTYIIRTVPVMHSVILTGSVDT